jgi:hypothetical protein
MAKIVGILVVILLAVLGIKGCLGCSEAEKKKELAELKSILVPLRFRVAERNYGSMKVEFNFYSLCVDDDERADIEDKIKEEKPFASREFTLGGEELFIDCLRFHEEAGGDYKHDVNWVFPYRIFTDYMPAEKGIPVYEYYEKNGFPQIYNVFELGADARDTLTRVFSDVKQYGNITDEELKKKITGNAIHDINKVARFQVGKWYDVVIHIKKGTVEFIAERGE